MRTVRMSERQWEVVTLVADGYADKEIALKLGLSLATVKTYLGRLYRHNGFRNRAEAAAACALGRPELVLTRLNPSTRGPSELKRP